jgi:CRP-like cAMP-binding protein/Zn-dependent protease
LRFGGRIKNNADTANPLRGVRYPFFATADVYRKKERCAVASLTSSVWQRLSDEPAAGAAGQRGLWDALREHLNPAQYRPGRAEDVTAAALTNRQGQPYYILANRRYSRYLRLSPEDYHLWKLMDGTRSIKDLIFEYFTAFGVLAFDRVAQLVLHLRLYKMLADHDLNVFALIRQVLDGIRGRSFLPKVWQAIIGQRNFQIRRIDEKLGALHRSGGWLLYTTPMQALYVAVSLVGGWFFVQHLLSGRYDLFQAGGSYTTGLVLLAVLNYVSITVHEGSHALTCKHYGAHVNGAGVMLYYGLPAFFIDTTDIWTKSRGARIATTWAGPYSGVILAGLGAIAVQAAPASSVAPILHRLSFLWMLTLLFNLIPFLELDGYFILIDWLEFPMLRSRALAFFRKDLWGKLKRRERLTGEERFLGWFGGVSFAFSILIVVLSLGSWRYRLKSLTTTLWGGGLGSKVLLVFLLGVLILPLGVGLGGRALSVTRAAARWGRGRWREPRRHTLRQREALLREVHFFASLSAEDMTQIAARMIRRTFRAGEVVFRQGEEGDRFYVIERGVAEVWIGDEHEARRHLTRGDYFGELALLGRVSRSATIRAGTPLVVLSVGRGDFDRLVARHLAGQPRVAERIQTCERLRRFPLLAELSSRELDALASKLRYEQFAAGEAVVAEGDPGDAFFLVDSGQAEIVAGGRRVQTIGSGSYFGEIALLLHVPRQATVRALTPLAVYALDRTDFEALIVTTLHKVASVLEDVGRERLSTLRGPSAVGRPGAA